MLEELRLKIFILSYKTTLQWYRWAFSVFTRDRIGIGGVISKKVTHIEW